MEEVFMEKHSIHPSLVADVHQYVYRRTGVIGIQPEEVTEAAKRSVMENRLHRCLICGALSELHVPPEWLLPGGKLYNLAKSTHGQLRPDKNYSFPLNNVVCSYDPQRDVLIPDYKMSSLNTCNWCHGTSVRHIHGDGAVVYLDGDRTNTRSDGGKCGCGFKHFWESKEYDNLPEAFPITLEWGGRVVRETVYWFQYEVEATLNSNVYDVAMKLVTKHFPGEFGSETLVQKVVNTILHHTAKKNPDEYNPVSIDGAHDQRLTDAMDQQPPTKIILTGQKSKTLHKEELTMSRAERSLQQSISDQAFVTQRRRTDKLKQEQKGNRRSSSPTGSPETSSSSSAPATPTKTSSSPSSNEKKIRVTTSDGRQAMLTLHAVTTFSELQRRISTQFNVPPSQQQCIRYGFPPKELLRPRDGEENEPVALQHGDRVTVEILKVLEEEQGPPAVTPPSSHSVLHSEKRSEETSSGRELQESIDLEMSSLCLLATLMGEDVWSYAKKLPHLFQQGGVFYNIVKKDMGLLDGKHCSLPHLTGKTFVFNAAAERLDLCVDAAGHFPVSPEVEEQVKEALLQLQVRSEASGGNRESSEASGVLRLGGGGVVRKKESFQSLNAFQGRGHSLGSSSPPEHRPITRQHSSGVDLSSSVTRGAPDLSQIPELVRMAPGFVRMKEGGRPDPGLMEQQRRQLQDMVSSIQASMERHLREGTTATTVTSQQPTSADQQPSVKQQQQQPSVKQQPNAAEQQPTSVAKPPDGKPDPKEEGEQMESQEAGPDGAIEPMDHS
ncbi:hypothetical protein CesoFtcFv8_015635 [Champsocephalus esox]|nr:hypothetical protein CesoFtcFv8_015635 [Champsocephalus esox]